MKPKETIRRRITDVHGSLKSIEVRALVKKKGGKKNKRKKEQMKLRKEESKEKLIRCKEMCM